MSGKVTCCKLDVRGTLAISYGSRRVGIIFAVPGGWAWRAGDQDLGIPDRDTKAECRRPYTTQAEARLSATKHVRFYVRHPRRPHAA